MTTTTLPQVLKFREVDAGNNPLVGGKLFTYVPGTTTKRATYTSAAGTAAQGNPIILDSRGEATFWPDVSLGYKYVLAPATDTDPPTAPIWTIDNVPAANAVPSALVGAMQSGLAASAGATQVGFLAAGAGATARTVAAKLRDIVSVKDFGAVGDGSTDDTAAINSALAAAGIGSTVCFPPGRYKVAGTLNKLAGQRLAGAGWAAQIGSTDVLPGSTVIVQHSTADIPLIQTIGNGTAQALNGGIENLALMNSAAGATVGVGYRAEQAPQEILTNVYATQFATGFEQGQNCWGWQVSKARVLDAAVCWYAHDEGEDSVYTNCLFRSYRSTGVAYHADNMAQTNLFLGCDFSDNSIGVLLSQGDTHGDGTGTPYPMHATFVNCQFEDNIQYAVGLASSGQTYASSAHPMLTMIGCRAYISGTFAGCAPNSGQSVVFAQHASQVKVENLVSAGYSYGMTIGLNGYQGAYVVGTPCGPITWGNDAACTWGTARFQGSTASVTLVPGDRPLCRLTASALSYASGGYTRVPFTVVVSDAAGWADAAHQGVTPKRHQTMRVRAQVSVASAPAGRYVLLLYKNGAPFATLSDSTVSTAGNPLTMAGEALDVPDGVGDFYWITVYATASFTLNAAAGSTFMFAETAGC